MPASIHFLPYSENTLERVAGAVLESYIPLERTAVVFTSARALSFFRNTLFATAGKPLLQGPYLFLQDDFMLQCLEPANGIFPSTLERRVFLRQAMKQAGRELGPLFRGAESSFLEDYLAFASVGDGLFRFYDELMAEDLAFERLRGHALYTEMEKHVAVLESIWTGYLDILEENGYTDKSFFKRSSRPDPRFHSRFDHMVFVPAGFLSQVETLVIRQISKHAKIDLFISHEGSPVRQHMELARALCEGEPPSPAPAITRFPRTMVREFPDALTQAGYVGWAIEECRAEGIRDEDIAVVLPDEGFVQSLTATLGRGAFNIAMGFPMGTSPYFTLLETAKRLFLERSPDGFECRSLLAFIRHPLIKNSVHSGSTLHRESSGLATEVEKKLMLRFPGEALKKFPGISAEVREARALLAGQGSLADIARIVIDYLDGLESRWNPDFGRKLRLDRDARSGRETVVEALAELAATGLAKEVSGSGATLLESLLAGLAGRTYPAVNREGRINVIGLLETRNIRFEAVIMPDMNEGLIPAANPKDMFLNSAIRRSLGLPTIEDREALYGVYLRQLLGGAKKAYLSWVRSDERGLRSRFLDHFVPEGQSEESMRKGKEFFRSALIPGPWVARPAPEAVRKDAGTLERTASLTYSASSLETYLACPYRFYLKYVCRVDEPSQIDRGLPPHLKGSIFHGAVRALYEDPDIEGLIQSPEAHHARLCLEIDRIASGYDQIRLVPSNKVTIDNWKKRLFAFSENEAAIFAEGWRVADTEREVMAVTEGGYAIKGFIDRIDHVNGAGGSGKAGAVRIIDYKTGSLPGTKKECRLSEGRGVFRKLQLPFYLLLLSIADGLDPERVEGLYFYDLKKNYSLAGMHEDFHTGPRTEYMKRFAEFILGILSEINDPETGFEHTADRRNCRYCSYDLICRIEDREG